MAAQPRPQRLPPVDRRAGGIALVAVAGVLTFGALAWAAMSGASTAVDEAVLQALRVPGAADRLRGPALLAEAARDVTALGSHAVVTLVLVGVVGFLLLARKPRLALSVLAAGSGGMVLNQVLKTVFARPRPHLVPWLVQVESPSFPSGHALLSSAVYLSMAMVIHKVTPQRRLRLFVVGAAATVVALVGASRVVLGVHYPTDVIAGWVAGGLWALVCGGAAGELGRRGAIEPAVSATELSDEAEDPPVPAAPRR
jgi:undecaprenyl-diphosphatase